MTLIIAAAQSRSVPGDIPKNVARHLQFGVIAAEHEVQLLVFPELSLTGYEPALALQSAVRLDAGYLEPLLRFAKEANMTVIAGAPVLNDKKQLHIGALAICPNGGVVVYTKQHLHPGEEEVFTAGQGGPTVLPMVNQQNSTTVALAICADTTHPTHAAQAAARRANVYAAGVLITETGYAADTALMRQYAREHKMAVVMANYSGESGGWASAGKSALWAEDGALIAASTGTEEALVVGRKREGVWSAIVVAPLPSAAIAGQREAR